MKIILTLFFILNLTACFKKAAEVPKSGPDQVGIKPAALRDDLATKTEFSESKFDLLSKEQREAIYFSASLEKEALRVMTKNQFADDMSLFSVLSYAVESNAGVKKTSPSRLDCTRFRFAKNSYDKRLIHVSKVCQKPETKVANIQIGVDPNRMTVTFLIKEWASVVGLSVSVTGRDVVCEIQIKDKKMSQLACENWTKNLVSSNTSSEELKLKTFAYSRQQKNQFTVQGGIFKDLVERKKIEMHVPLEGKIKLIEKEIEVIDEFMQADKVIEPVQRLEIKASSDNQSIEKLGEQIEKNSQNQNEGFENEEPIQSEKENSQDAEGKQKDDQQKSKTKNQTRGQRQTEKVIPEGWQNEENGGIPPEGR